MDELDAWLSDLLVVETAGWLRAVIDAGAAMPWFAMFVLGLVVFAGAASRSILIFLAASVLGALSIWLLANAHTPPLQRLLPGFGATALLFLAGGLYRLRRKISQRDARLQKLLSEKEETQALLDREIRWRTAAEPIVENAPNDPTHLKQP